MSGNDYTLLKPTGPEDRIALAAWLQGLADDVLRGDIEADAGVIALSDGDVHRVTWTGYRQRARMQEAARDIQTEIWHTVGDREKPEARAARRRKLRAITAMEAHQYERDHPFHCECRRRFKTERGLVQHARLMRYGEHRLTEPPEPETLRVVRTDAAPKGGA